MKQRGSSTLGGLQVWFDRDILRLNYDGRGEELGEFHSDDHILVVLNNGDFYMTNFDLSNHYEQNILVIEKYQPGKTWTAIVYDADQKYYYLKRFLLEASARKQSFLGENPKNRLMLLTDEAYPRVEVVFGGHDSFREALVIDVDEFTVVRGFKAKGRRVSSYEIASFNELEPNRLPEATSPESEAEALSQVEETDEEEPQSHTDILDEITGQMNLFKNNPTSDNEE